jgi:signal transduction histidine kinase
MSRTQAYWICQIGGWTLVSGISLLLVNWKAQEGWDILLNQVLSVGLGVGITHAFRAYAHRVGWLDLSLRRLAPRVVVAALVLSAGFNVLGDVPAYFDLIDVVGMSEEEYWTARRFAFALFGNSILMGLWLAIYFGVHAAWNYRQAEVDKWKLEAQAETARLKALKLQLNPHFFFNSLNSVRALIAEDPERAQRMVTRLARLLRNTLQVDDVKTVPLEEELSTVRTYLELESVRFEDRLQYEIDADEGALNRPVPFLLVQTLVENGIKHGVAHCQQGGTITVDARVKNNDLCIQVTNPGTLESEEGGTGLTNARERLRLLFGGDASLTVQNADPATVEATVMLPARPEAEGPTVQTEPGAALAVEGQKS